VDARRPSLQNDQQRSPLTGSTEGAPPKPAALVVSYPVARAASVLLTACGFFVINLFGALLIGAALDHALLRLDHARWFLVIGLASTSFFAGHSAAIGMLDGYVQGRLRLASASLQLPAAESARNPWQVALASLCVWGAGAAAIGGWCAPWLWPNGVPLSRFAWQFAAATALLGSAIVYQQTGRKFWGQVRLPPERRRFAGTQAAYLWQRHALPQGLVNAFVNGWIGAAIVPGTLSTGTTVTASFLQRDMIGTALVLTFVIAAGVHSYARFDRRWGVVPRLPVRGLRPLAALLALPVAVVASSFACAGLLGPNIGVWPFLIARTVGCGLYCAGVAYEVARWTLSSSD
jgi:hypothetical protein